MSNIFRKTRERVGGGLQKAGDFVQNSIGLPTTLFGVTMGLASGLLPVLQPWRLGTTLLGGSLIGGGWMTKKLGQVIDTTSHQLASI